MSDLPSGFASTLDGVEAKRVEWPAGSGVSATYSPAERLLVRALFRLRDEEKISEEQLYREVGVFHDLKALLGAKFVEAEREPEQFEFALPPPDSAFQIPPRALRRLVGAERSYDPAPPLPDELRPKPTPDPRPDHFLVVSECGGERDYEIEHPDGCPTSVWKPSLENCPDVLCYECAVGSLWEAVGRDGIDGIEALAPGKHPVKVVTEHTPSLPTNDGEEWDAWIEVAA